VCRAVALNTWFQARERQRQMERWNESLLLTTPEGAYRDIFNRQAERKSSPLSNSSESVARNAEDCNQRQRVAAQFGDFIASLCQWDWFINPISFRDRHRDLERSPESGEPRTYRSVGNVGNVSYFPPDPCLKGWLPDYKGRKSPAPPVKDLALIEIKDYLFELQEAGEQPINWMIAEEFGTVSGRHHCHLLVAGVGHVRRDHWWKIAFERFGRTRIEPFDREKAAAFYCAKYAAKQVGGIHFGGPSPGESYAAVLTPGPQIGRVLVVGSADMARAEFRRTSFHPKGYLNWRSKR
jgi:hypothetical protein